MENINQSEVLDDLYVMIERKREQIFYAELSDCSNEIIDRLKLQLEELESQFQELLNESTE